MKAGKTQALEKRLGKTKCSDKKGKFKKILKLQIYAVNQKDDTMPF